MPPDISGGFAACGFFCSDEAGGHVRNAIACAEVECVAGGAFGVPENVVVLGRPFFCGACAVVIGPDDLVLEGVAAEDLVEKDFAVVNFAIVDVKKERAGGGEDSMGFDESRAKEAEEVVEPIAVAGVGVAGEDFGSVTATAEANAIA